MENLGINGIDLALFVSCVFALFGALDQRSKYLKERKKNRREYWLNDEGGD